MIEKAARVLCWKNGMDPDTSLGGDGENFLWMEYVDEVRAVIECLEWPSDAMVEIGALAINKALAEGFAIQDAVEHAYRRMLKVAAEDD
jgi:hypothetical protein